MLKLRDQSQQEILDECVDVSVYNPDGDENFVNIDFWFKKDGDYIYNFTGNLYNPMTGLTCFNVNKEEQVIVEGKPEIIETESAQHIIKETYKNTYRKEEVDELIKNIDYSDFATKADVSANYQKKGNYVQDVSINDIIDDTMYRVKTLDYDLYYGPREWKRLKNGT